MNKVLYEIGFRESLSGIIIIISNFGMLFLSLFLFLYSIKEKSRAIIKTIIVFIIICTIFTIKGSINRYTDIVIGYRNGDYVEVEGRVEDYYESIRGTYENFSLDGVSFECSNGFSWGYRRRGNNNVIVSGRHLRIRYIPYNQENTIVYIEQMMQEEWNTEEAQQEGEIKEPAVPIDQIGIQGRTEEETELIRKILSQDKEEFQRFLMADGVYPYKETIRISTYDLTGDGRDEILVSKYYKDMSAELTYNYVYDQTGRRVLEFVGGGDTQIIAGWDGNGTFLLYDQNDYFSAPHYFTNTYTEIRCEDDVLSEKVILVELDRRPPGDYGEEEYYIFTYFTKEEEEKLWEGGSGINELTETKAYVREDKRAEEYKQLFEENETTGFSRIAMIRYSESDGFQEYVEE